MIDARTLYRESVVRGATPVRLVVMLYEQIVEDLRRAVAAIQDNRVDDRTNAINHAMLIVGHLQSTLDLEAGGKVARNLDRFYNLLRPKLLEAQFRASKEILEEQISLVLNLRDAWTKVDEQEGARSAPTVASPSESAGPSLDQHQRADWKV